MNHSNYRHHKLAIVALLLNTTLFFCACDNNTSTPNTMDMVPDLSGQQDMLDDQTIKTDMRLKKDMSGDMGKMDMSGDLTTGPKTLTIRLVPVEWGLFEQDVDPTPKTFTTTGTQSFESTIVWPVGVWHLEVELDGTRLMLSGDKLSGLARSQDQLVAASDEGAAPIFSVVDEPVTIKTDFKTLDIQRVKSTAAAIKLGDLPDPQTSQTVGPLFDAAIYEINTDAAPHNEIVERLKASLLETGLAPVASPRGLFFIASGQDGSPAPEIRGTFTNWDPSDKTIMRKLTGGLWGRFIVAPDYQAYKVVYGQGQSWVTDTSNRHIKWDGINTNSIGNFNSILGVNARPSDTSRMVWWPAFNSPELGANREVYVHLPRDYDALTMTTFPTLYIHDGNESIVRSQFQDELDQWSSGHMDRSVVGVFIALPSQNVRFDEYTMAAAGARGDDYAKFVAKTLVVAVDAHFKTRTDAKSRGLLGASLGGLISFWIAINYPETFEYTAGMSSSFFWSDDFMLKEVQRRGCLGLRYYIDSGSPNDNADVTRLMRDLLQSKGCDYKHIEETGGTHDWSFWKGRFPGALDVFYQGYTAP